MRVLALDTTTRAGSVAVLEDDRLLHETRGDAARSNAERLPGELLRAVQLAGLQLPDIDVYAVAAGPGSFTGLRIGIAAIQGLAFVARKPVAPISALQALAHAAAADVAADLLVGAWMDARRGEVFSALYRVGAAVAFSDQRLTEVEGPAVGRPEATWSRWTAAGCAPAVLVGDGAVAYAAAIDARTRVADAPLLAPILGRLAVERARRGQTVSPAGIQPLYVRRPDAEIARDAFGAPSMLKGKA
jgi:tRNA threonylcarbamoyladenosine biosynthesis protein TsaB